MAVENDLALQLIPILLNVIVLDHNDHHIHLIEELVKVQNLVLDELLVGEEGIEGLQFRAFCIDMGPSVCYFVLW